jgi:hypothetical protein
MTRLVDQGGLDGPMLEYRDIVHRGCMRLGRKVKEIEYSSCELSSCSHSSASSPSQCGLGRGSRHSYQISKCLSGPSHILAIQSSGRLR